MQNKSFVRIFSEVGVGITAIAALVLAGCSGSSSSGGSAATPTSVVVSPYKGRFNSGATIVIKDAKGNPITLLSGGTVNASGIADLSFNSSVAYPLIVEVTGSYYNEVTGTSETSTTPLRSVVPSAASSIPVTIVTETAVAGLGSFSATAPITAASAVASLSAAGTMLGVPASAIPSFDSATNKTSDADTIRLSALAIVANKQAGATLADKVKALANTMATLNAASAPADVVSQADMDSAMTSMTSGTLSVMAGNATKPASPAISTATASLTKTNATTEASNSIVGTWSLGTSNGMTNDSIVTFFANGDYMHAKAVTTNAGASPGIEHGQYKWNSTTGAFSTICPPDADTNGTDGFSSPGGVTCTGSTASTGTITVSGNKMSFTVNGNPTATLTRTSDATNPLIGSWYNQKNNGASPSFGTATTVMHTFFANGDYVMSQSVIDPKNGTGTKPGLEHGTYTWNSSTKAFVANCPTVDTNGSAGFSHQDNPTTGCTSGNAALTGTITMSADTNTITITNTEQGSVTFDRVK